MSGIRLEYSINDSPAMAMLQRLENADTRPMFDEIGVYLDSAVAKRFVDGVDPDGNEWLPSQRAEREGGKTLVDHGHLRDSFTYNVFIDGKGVEHGSDMIYAAIHQFGGKAGRNHSVEIDARPVLGINADDEEEIEDIVNHFYQSVLNG